MPDKYDSTTNEETGKEISTEIELSAELNAEISKHAETIRKLGEYASSVEFSEAEEAVFGFSDFTKQNPDVHAQAASKVKSSNPQILAFLWYELERLKKNGICTGIDLPQMAELSVREPWDIPVSGFVPDELEELYAAIRKAADRFRMFCFAKEAVDIIEYEAEDAVNSLPNVVVKATDTLDYPLDKISTQAFSLLSDRPDGKIEINLKAEKQGSKTPLNIYYALDFDELIQSGIEVDRKLTAFDKRVYLAVSALYNAGNEYMSLAQIYFAMGHPGKNPSRRDYNKISESLTKMARARLTVDNSEEAAAYKYQKIQYDAHLLPMERVSAILNGVVTEASVHLFREPPMVSFAKSRKQITTIKLDILQSPVNKTDGNLALEDYLIERIARMKNGTSKSSRKILYKTIFERTNMANARQKQRAKETIRRYLDHYKASGFIDGYKETDAGIEIIFKKIH